MEQFPRRSLRLAAVVAAACAGLASAQSAPSSLPAAARDAAARAGWAPSAFPPVSSVPAPGPLSVVASDQVLPTEDEMRLLAVKIERSGKDRPMNANLAKHMGFGDGTKQPIMVWFNLDANRGAGILKDPGPGAATPYIVLEYKWLDERKRMAYCRTSASGKLEKLALSIDGEGGGVPDTAPFTELFEEQKVFWLQHFGIRPRPNS